jgi:hypothetical protein
MLLHRSDKTNLFMPAIAPPPDNRSTNQQGCPE